MTSSLSVVDLTEEQEEQKKKDSEEKDKKLLEELESDPEDALWNELLKCLSKLSLGVTGDLSSLGRSVRMLNRFRRRMPDTTWIRIVYLLVPVQYRPEFEALLSSFMVDLHYSKVELISNLTAVEFVVAQQKMEALGGDVFASVLDIVAGKEGLAKAEIRKRQKEIATDRKNRIAKQKLNIFENNPTATAAADAAEAEANAGSKMDVEEERANNNTAVVERMDEDTENETDTDTTAATTTTTTNTDASASASASAKPKTGSKAKADGGEGEGEEKEIKVSLMPLKQRKNKKKAAKFYPETYVYLQLMIALELLDRNEYESALAILNRLILFSKEQNRRTCDLLSSRLYQFQTLCFQRLKQLHLVRNQFFLDYQTACIQQNFPVQSVLINSILQSYISQNLYSLAHKFAEKVEFPADSESQQFARYHYYRGRIDCIQLQYADALDHIQQAIRRAPQLGANAFKLNSIQWLIVIQLLMGDIPDRNTFDKYQFTLDREDDSRAESGALSARGAHARRLSSSSSGVSSPRKFDLNSDGSVDNTSNLALAPFLEITEAVREGQINRYLGCLRTNAVLFESYGLTKVLLRLRHNVIKTGLRKINKSYSRIYLSEIAAKLNLSSVEDAYYIVAKAIKDGVINASINYDEKYMESDEMSDIYTSEEPFHAFSQRVKFCLDIRNQAVKALIYPNASKDGAEDEDEEDEKKDDFVTEEEVAEMIQKHLDRHNHDTDDDEDEN